MTSLRATRIFLSSSPQLGEHVACVLNFSSQILIVIEDASVGSPRGMPSVNTLRL
jgi:hypothetical protein